MANESGLDGWSRRNLHIQTKPFLSKDLPSDKRDAILTVISERRKAELDRLNAVRDAERAATEAKKQLQKERREQEKKDKLEQGELRKAAKEERKKRQKIAKEEQRHAKIASHAEKLVQEREVAREKALTLAEKRAEEQFRREVKAAENAARAKERSLIRLESEKFERERRKAAMEAYEKRLADYQTNRVLQPIPLVDDISSSSTLRERFMEDKLTVEKLKEEAYTARLKALREQHTKAAAATRSEGAKVRPIVDASNHHERTQAAHPRADIAAIAESPIPVTTLEPGYCTRLSKTQMLSDADSSNPVLAASVNMRLLQLIDATRETTSSPLAEVSTTNRPHHTPNGQGDTFRPRRQPESDPTALTHAPSGASADASRTMRRDGAETTRLVVISLAGNGQPVASLTTQNGDVIHITDESDFGVPIWEKGVVCSTKTLATFPDPAYAELTREVGIMGRASAIRALAEKVAMHHAGNAIVKVATYQPVRSPEHPELGIWLATGIAFSHIGLLQAHATPPL